ncbi:transporter [uncultured Shewanella sp.]|uniref:SphA family protein n=1 Tax=uncultured Shewanella sp. TaxID=173975 RepID=UPI002631DE40|nr:transporter [uncultured Shewanella sp.]
MRKSTQVFIGLLVNLTAITTAHADGLIGAGHYTPGAANIRDMTMPDQAGFIYEQYNIHYDSNDLKNKNGDSIGLNTDYEVAAIAPLFMWVTDKNVLGARYSFYINPSVAASSVAGEETYGVGDTYVQPLWLGWLNPNYDINLGLGFYLPTGEDGLSLDMVTTQVQLSGYYYVMEQAGAFMLSATYEFHGESDSTGVTAGDHLTIEYGYSQYLTQQLEVGLKGYSQWQVQEDDLSNEISNFNQKMGTHLGTKSEVHGLGVQVAYWLDPHWNLSFNYMKEYSTQAKFEGEIFSFNITYSPKALF